MQQLARLKFTSFNLKVPQNWKDPQGDPDAKHYKGIARTVNLRDQRVENADLVAAP